MIKPFPNPTLEGYLLGHREVHEAGHVVIAEVLGWPQNGVTVDPARASPLPDGSFAEGEAFIPSDIHQWTRGDGHKQRVAAVYARILYAGRAAEIALLGRRTAAAMLSITSTQGKRSGGAGPASIPHLDDLGTARSCGRPSKTTSLGEPNGASRSRRPRDLARAPPQLSPRAAGCPRAQTHIPRGFPRTSSSAPHAQNHYPPAADLDVRPGGADVRHNARDLLCGTSRGVDVGAPELGDQQVAAIDIRARAESSHRHCDLRSSGRALVMANIATDLETSESRLRFDGADSDVDPLGRVPEITEEFRTQPARLPGLRPAIPVAVPVGPDPFEDHLCPKEGTVGEDGQEAALGVRQVPDRAVDDPWHPADEGLSNQFDDRIVEHPNAVPAVRLYGPQKIGTDARCLI
jgi:hypothetical protein